MARSFEHEMEYPHPPEKVWRSLTEPDHIGQWFPSAWGKTTVDFKPVVGASFRLEAEKKRGWRGHVVGTILEVEPPRRLAYTWVGSPQEDERPTNIEWTLEPTATGTRVRLVYTMAGFTGPMGWLAYQGARFIWRKMMNETLSQIMDAPTPVL